MNKFWTFLKLLYFRVTSRVFWFWDAIGTLAAINPALPVSVPEIDWKWAIGIYAGVLLSSMYLVWRDERLAAEQKDAEIAALIGTLERNPITKKSAAQLELIPIQVLDSRVRAFANEST